MTRNNAVGIIELSSISRGYSVEDAVLKSANVEKVLSRTICSGKFLIVVRGEIADVESCLRLAESAGGFAVIQTVILPNIDEKVFPALSGATALESAASPGALIFETFTASSAIKISDIAVKEADVSILRIHVAMAIGGKGLVVLTGDMESLQSALGPVLDYMKGDGMLAGYSLIPNPHPDLLRELI
jgi:microcompartment protein CcmL/EutN